MNKANEYIIGKLSNGLTIVAINDDADIEYCGVAIRAGSRDELPGEYGLAHFVEHTFFKGTERRRSSSIINHMERVGGELNAYTTKEETFLYTVAPKGSLTRSMVILSDLLTSATFPARELEKEREVILEEIDSYLDSPSESVYDEFEDRIFAGTPLGHNILGTAASISRFHTEDCKRFVARLYKPSCMVFFYLGSEKPDRIFRMVEKYFGAMSEDNSRRALPHGELTVAERFIERKDIGENHQSHTIVGARVPSIYNPERLTLALYNNILGGPGMTSRLNVALREHRGLVYSVDSSLSLYSDAGLLTIYFGCNPSDFIKCRRIIERELLKLADCNLTERQLEQTKRQYLGQTLIASSSLEHKVLSAARAVLYFGSVMTSKQIAERINAITADALHQVAEQLLPESFSSLSIG